jgi:Flp pilus assembly protein TadB
VADKTTGERASLLGVGAAACVACCAPPVIAFVAAASVGTLLGVVAFGVIGLAVLVPIVLVHRRSRRTPRNVDSGIHVAAVPVELGREHDA